MKKVIFLFATILLSGCATTPQIVPVPKIQAPADIMKDCAEFTIPYDGTLKAFMTAMLSNKKNYELCSNQNTAKKEFIERISQ